MNTIPAAILDELQAAEDFEAAAIEAEEITGLTLMQRRMEFDEASEALDRAATSNEAAQRAVLLAQARLATLRKTSGVVRTADGYKVRTP